MDPEDLLELGGIGVLFGGFEIIESLLAVVLVVAVLVGVVAAVAWLGWGAVEILVVLGLMLASALAGALGGMKAQKLRGKVGSGGFDL